MIAGCILPPFTASAAETKAGDVNADSRVNSTDSLLILMYVSGAVKDKSIAENGDIDGDGKIASGDSLLILQHSAGVEIKPKKVVIDKKDMLCKKGDSFTVSGKVYPLLADDIGVKWTSSDSKVATVDKNGSVKVAGDGSCKITCASAKDSKVSASFQVVSGVKATSVSLDKTSGSAAMGKNVQLKATVSPSNAYSGSFTWKSSDSAIASVDSNGKVKAKSMGTATITCTTVDGSKKSATYKITVNMMKVPYVNQLNDYPTGCEAASACMLLKYYGFKITMKEMVDIIPRQNLEVINGKWYGPDINEKFVGDPRYGYRSSIRGYGAFSPVVTKSLQKAIDQRGGGYTAKNITGGTFDDLLKTVSGGKPAIVWATYNMNTPTEVNAWYIKSTGKYFEYPKGTHVMVLCGYDKNNVYVMDPYNYSSAKSFSRSSFKSKWELLGKQTIILEKNK